MIKKYLLTACMALLTYLAGTAQNTVRYGYCPENLTKPTWWRKAREKTNS